MNKRGFTLVELMGVLVILGVLLIFTVPTVTKTLKNSEKNEKAEYDNTVCLAVKSYVEIKREVYPFTISLGELRDEGYLSTSLKNPETDSLDADSVRVKISMSSGKAVCTYQ